MDPIEVRCPLPKRPGVSNRCGIKFAVEFDEELAVWTGACPEHGAQNFCGSVSGSAGVDQFRAREDDPENKEEAKPAGEAG